MKTWLVGSGYWGSKIITTLTNLGHDVKIIDIKNGSTIDDIDTLDPVILATPSWEHYAQASALIKKGHDVYITKPAAETAAQVKQLLDLVKDQVVMVGHIFVHNPLIGQLKHLVDSNILGNIKFIHSERTNLGIYQTKTSTLLSLAPHDFSIIEYLIGELNIQNATGYKLSDNIQYDRVSVTGNSKDIPWQIDISWRWPIRRRIVTVVGDVGQAVWDEDKKSIEIHYNNVEEGRLVSTRENEILHNYSTKDPLTIELEHFFECVINRSKSKTDLNSALTVARAIDAADICLQNTL